MWNKLSPDRQARAEEALKAVETAFQGRLKPGGLGLKKLKDPFWEVRTDLKDRIIFALEKDLVTFVLIGNHDEVHRFLRSN